MIDDNGEQLGIMPTEDALSRARGAGLDLIEISPNAQPPVVRIGDYGRLKYEQSKKDKDARKKQRNFELREVKLRPKIETHDYETKARMAEDMAPLATVEREPRLEGRNMFMILAPRTTPTGPPKFTSQREHEKDEHKPHDDAHAEEHEEDTKEPTSA